MDKLLPQVEAYVSSYMSKFDASHNYQHVQRVLCLARKIEVKERLQNPTIKYDSGLIALSALLHDIGDRKYLQPGESKYLASEALLSFGADEVLAGKVQTIINHVSYTSEVNGDPAEACQVLERFPELGIVQDADRLDAIGAIGIGRCFAYGGAKTNRSLEDTLGHFEVKLVKLEDMMKTATGKEMARARTERLRMFQEWWAEETTDASPSRGAS
jgi:uncharacterized protein